MNYDLQGGFLSIVLRLGNSANIACENGEYEDGYLCKVRNYISYMLTTG